LPRPAIDHWRHFLEHARNEDEKANDEADWLTEWVSNEIQLRDGKNDSGTMERASALDERPSAPSGFLGGRALAVALGVHPSRREAFFVQLQRKRISLGDDCWIQVADKGPNRPEFLYRADSPHLRNLAAAYVKPKPA
jgi:hypothetical protein